MYRSIALITLILCSCSNTVIAADSFYTFDLTYTKTLEDKQRIWDETHFAVTLQGVVNSKTPKLYVFFTGDDGSTDKFWLKYLQESKFAGSNNPIHIDSIRSLANTFKESINGLVVYDGNVPATSNAASTIAGVEKLAAVRYDASPNSLYTLLTSDPAGPKLKVKKQLVNLDGTSMFTGQGIIPGTKTKSTGSAKCDVYIWAKEKYIDTGKCNPSIMGYYVDSYCIPQLQGVILPFHTLVNHDYIVAKKGFVFDLSPWEDETPVDDKHQKLGTDYNTFKAILQSAYNRLNGRSMVSVSGYIPFWFKYSNIAQAGGKHEPVYGEFRLSGLLASYNAFLDADAIDRPEMANASVFCKFPLRWIYKQNKPTIESLKSLGYIDSSGKVAEKAFVCMYVGDYDSAAWMYRMIPRLWGDSARGKIPLGWAFNPNLAARFAAGMHYVRTNASPNDYFIAGACGAGYLHPRYLVKPSRMSELPSGVYAWVRHNQRWMKKFDISITGFIIDGSELPMRTPNDHPDVWDAYSKISPDGIGGQFIRNIGVHNGMPYMPMEWQNEVLGSERLGKPALQETYNSYADFILRRASKSAPSFALYRTILWHPDEIKTLMDTLKQKEGGDKVEFVDPYTMMLLVKQFIANKQEVKLLDHGIWEIGSSVEVTGNSGVTDGYDIRDLFGCGFGTFEHKAVAFKDGIAEPFTHWVEWKTVNQVKVDGFNLYARSDRISGREDVREFKAFRLFGKQNLDDEWILLDEYTPEHPFVYKHGMGELPVRGVVFKEPFIGRYFRAEFDQYDSKLEPKRGPRIVEIEGVGSIIQ